jgi:hypothetical protein
MNSHINYGVESLYKYVQSLPPYEIAASWTTSREFVPDKLLVPPPGIEPGSMDFQSTAMTTFAKAAKD